MDRLQSSKGEEWHVASEGDKNRNNSGGDTTTTSHNKTTITTMKGVENKQWRVELTEEEVHIDAIHSTDNVSRDGPCLEAKDRVIWYEELNFIIRSWY